MGDLMQSLQSQLLGGDPALVGRAIQLSAVADVHVDRYLTNMLVEYENRELIADKVMPRIKVNNKSDKFAKWDENSNYTLPNASMVGTKSRPTEIDYQITSDSYACENYGLMKFVPIEEEANADAPIKPRIVAAKRVNQFMMLAREKRVADLAFATASYGSNTAALAGNDRWDNSASDPVQKIDDVIEACKVKPNKMIIGAQAWLKLRNHAKFLDFIKARASTVLGSTPLRVTREMVAAAFELDEVVVGGAQYNTAREGASASLGYIWGKSCALIRVEPNPDPQMTETFGYTFEWQGPEVQVIWDPVSGLKGGNWIKVTMSHDEKAVGGGACGYLLTTVVS